MTRLFFSNVLTNIMGFYGFPKSIRHKLDMVREKFYWKGNNVQHKYHMVKWAHLCRPKEFADKDLRMIELEVFLFLQN